MTRAGALSVRAVMEALDPGRRERLLRINPHLAGAAISPAAAGPKSPGRMVTASSAPVVVSAPGRVDVLIPGLRLDVTPNSRMHWSARARAVAAQRAAVAAAFEGAVLPVLDEDTVVVVEMTRIGPRALDTDNAAAALKAPRDAIAEALGLRDDADPRVRWVCAQALPHTTWRFGLRVVVRVQTDGGT